MLAKEVILARRPSGWPDIQDFELVEVEVGDPEEDEVLVRMLWLSVDPYMRGRMNDAKSYVPPFKVNEPINGGAIGQVIASGGSALKVGDFVLGNLRWREFDVASVSGLRKLDPEKGPLSTHLGVLGMPGMTAFVGLRRIGGLRPSDTVFVSAAAGAVGSAAGQIAKISGATVIGSAGSMGKVQGLLEKGYDAAFNYKEKPVALALRELAPNGIDLYFDNVGGDHLEGALANMANFGRIVMCGAVSQYNLEFPSPGPSNLMLVVSRRLTMKGFIVTDHYDLQDSFYAEASGWIRHGKLFYDETIRIGLENAPSAFISMLKGENVGKMLVKVSDPV